MDTTNFKTAVSQEIRNKLREIASYIYENLSDMVGGHKSFGFLGCLRCDGIEGNYKSGWIPHQDGGFNVSELCQNDQDSSYHFTEKQTDFANDQAKACFDAFIGEHGLDADTSYGDLTEEQKEELCNYEREWFEAALLQFQMFVEGYTDWKNEEKQVTFRVSINYKDAPYYREKYAEDIKVVVLSVEEFLAIPNAEIIEQLKI